MTRSARRFATPLTFQVLSGRPVHHDLFEPREEVLHLRLAHEADLFLIAPATAHCIARLSLGLADDLLTTLALAARCPILLAPAMDDEMWEHPTVAEHLDRLRRRGVECIGPTTGPLASGRVGPGRLADEQQILDAVQARFRQRARWSSEVVLVSAGPTQEPIDPIRFLSNHSSGKMGFALAEEARDRGARTILLTGPTSVPPPGGVEVVSFRTAAELQAAVRQRLPEATIVLMAAAVADFRPEKPLDRKIKKEEVRLTLALEPVPDILQEVGASKGDRVVVGFAAETEHLVVNAKDKLRRKNLDLVVANNPTVEGSRFGGDTSAVTLIDRTGRVDQLPCLSKREVAGRILDRVEVLMGGAGGEKG